jgi:NAD(P)-dependent dehydrogenase (short-subunit alcohol dehydrogenase family)
MTDTTQKTLLVTGASAGLGVAIAVQAAQAGFRTVATMRDLSKRAILDAALANAGVTAEVLALDVQDTATIMAAMAQAGRIDVLVNNAGMGFARSTEQATEADIARVLDINLMGVIRTTKAVLPQMRARRSGRVIAISSVGGLVGQPFNEVYCASKFAVEGFMESLATYAGPRFGLHFTVVEPGGIRSEFAARAMAQIAETGGMLDDEYLPILQDYMAGIQARAGEGGTYQTVDEVSRVVIDMATRDAPPVRVRTSDWAEAFCALKTAADPDGTKLRDQVYARFLGGAA